MQENIGSTAGKVWDVLGQRGRLTLGHLPRFIDGNKEVAYLALGWLAREGKVKFEKKGDVQIISLTEGERENHKKNNNKE